MSFLGYINVGQNLFASSVKPNATVPAIGWHAEVKDFTFGQSTSAAVGHYTQVNILMQKRNNISREEI